MKKIKIKTGAAGGKRTGPARTFLERVFQTELGNPPDRGRGDLTELSTTCEVPVRIIQIGVIEGVEQFRAELKLMFLIDWEEPEEGDRKSTRLNSSYANISYAVFCLKKKK